MRTMKEHSADYQQFLKSLAIGYNEWHEGIGFDLDAIAALKGEERGEAEEMLLDRMKSGGGWREIEALATLDTESARLAIRGALRSSNMETRLRAAEQLVEMGEDVSLEQYIIQALRHGDLYEGASRAIDLAEENPTPAIRKALLELTLTGEREIRIHAAALSLYLAGKAEEPFDWNHRPFFLRFGEDDVNERQNAYAELCQRIAAA
jgi:hypothetical protein